MFKAPLRALRIVLGAFVFALLAPLAAQAEPVRLSYLFSDGNVPGTLKAYEALLAEHPELKGQIELNFVTESMLADVKPAEVESSNVLVFDTMNEQLLSKFNAQNKVNLLKPDGGRGVVVGVGQGLLPQDTYINQGVVWDQRARAYWEHSGAENQLSLMKFALSKAGVKGLDLPDPQLSFDFGFYYPDGKTGRVFRTWREFDDWRAANNKKRPGAPRVAIGFFKAAYYSGDTALIDALIASIEKKGGEAIPLFGYPGAVAFQRLLLDEKDEPRADVALGGNFSFSDFESSKLLGKVGIPVVNLVTLYGRGEAEWRKSAQGLTDFEGTFNLAVPELAGTTAPTVVGAKEKIRDPQTGLNSIVTSPIASRVDMAVSRALRYATLRVKPNSEKRVALLFYNYPPGKANIGASYLNVAETLANILARMKAEGYDIGGAAPSTDQVLKDITERARNVTSHAPGELSDLVAAGGAERISMTEYKGWLAEMAPSLRDKINKDWGDPEKSALMTAQDSKGASFVIPAVRYGKVLLTPQPSRAWGEDLEKLYHAKDLAPHHQYVAVYEWLRNGFKADAVVHIGTHGTLEWLDGKDVGLNEEDAPEALIGDLPHAYIYNVDVVGEGLVARRRSMATLVDHMTPPFKEGGLTEDLAKLGELINDHAQNETKNPELARAYAAQARDQAIKMGVAKDMSLPTDKEWTDEQLHGLEDYLLELRKQTIPYGLHAFGRTPEKELIDSTVKAIVSVDRSGLPEKKAIFADDMAQRIAISGPRELDGLMKALAGQFVPAAGGGEPIRNPDAYPTGNNFFGIDPDKVPKPAAWDMGAKLAQQMLEADYKKNGRYPEKVSFVIWGDETMRHEGVLESQIFYLLGTKPVWNERGKVVGVEVIPRAKLGRPRVDIIIASAAEGMFANVTNLMDEAVQRTKALDETDNAVRKHYLATKAALIAKGVKADLADRMAGVRIFDEPPGTYNLNTSTIVANSGSWNSDAGFANDYIRKMGHGYGNGFHGEEMTDVFRLALSGVEKVVHSNSTALYGSLDNDDMFMYMGGLSSAVRSIDGKAPEMVVTNSRDPGNPEMTSLDKFVGQEFRSRYMNPAWITGMKKEGYAGAGEMKAFVEYLWGWDATVSSVVDDKMWQDTFETYVEDKNNLGMKQFFETKSPFAYQDITARMIETVRKGFWRADEATKNKLVREYVESVNKHGVSCSDASCGNARLMDFIMQEAKTANIPAAAIDQARGVIEKAIGKKIETAAQQLRDFAERNDAREDAERAQTQAAVVAARANAPAPRGAQVPSPMAPQAVAQKAPLEGKVMQEESRTVKPPEPRPGQILRATVLDFAWPPVVLLGLLAGWYWRNRKQAHA